MLRVVFVIALSALVLLAGVAAEPQVLDSETYPVVTASGKWLVKFYAPWCTHCQKMEPLWKELSEKFENEKSEFQVAKVDCTVAKGVCESVGVKGFPTIMYISKDVHIVFKGSRTLEEFEKFTKRVTEDPIRSIVSASEFDGLKSKPNSKFYLLVLGEGDKAQQQAEQRANYEKVAQQMALESTFYLSSAGDTGLAPGVYVYKNGESSVYEGEESSQALLAWAKREKFPRFFQLTREVANEIEEPLVCMVVIKPDADNRVLFTVIEYLAKEGNGGAPWPCRFVWMDATGEWKSFVESRFHYYIDDLPRFVVYSVRTATYYEHPSTKLPTIESGKEFLLSVVNGNAEAKGGRGLVQDIKNYVFWLGDFISVSFVSAWNEYPHIVQLAGATVLFCLVVLVRGLFRPKQAARAKAE